MLFFVINILQEFNKCQILNSRVKIENDYEKASEVMEKSLNCFKMYINRCNKKFNTLPFENSARDELLKLKKEFIKKIKEQVCNI